MSSNTPNPPVALDAHFSSMLRENRVFAPPPAFAAKARIGSMEAYEAMYRRSIQDPENFWGEAAQQLHWFAPYKRVLDWQIPKAKWFVGGKLNLSYNCVDRHALGGKRDHTAILWEGEPGGESRRVTASPSTWG
jgi:acetyl-CoA synthetase